MKYAEDMHNRLVAISAILIRFENGEMFPAQALYEIMAAMEGMILHLPLGCEVASFDAILRTDEERK